MSKQIIAPNYRIVVKPVLDVVPAAVYPLVPNSKLVTYEHDRYHLFVKVYECSSVGAANGSVFPSGIYLSRKTPAQINAITAGTVFDETDIINSVASEVKISDLEGITNVVDLTEILLPSGIHTVGNVTTTLAPKFLRVVLLEKIDNEAEIR